MITSWISCLSHMTWSCASVGTFLIWSLSFSFVRERREREPGWKVVQHLTPEALPARQATLQHREKERELFLRAPRAGRFEASPYLIGLRRLAHWSRRQPPHHKKRKRFGMVTAVSRYTNRRRLE